jgi:hypothetical protein
MRKLRTLFLALLLLFGATVLWFWDRSPPRIELEGPAVVGREGRIFVRVEDSGKGLRSIEVIVRQDGQGTVVHSRRYPAPLLPWAEGERFEEIALSSWEGLSDGDFSVSVTAVDQGNLWLFSRTERAEFSLRLDTRPPRIDLLSQQHYLRQGGSETVLYQVNEGGRSGVTVGENVFLGYPVPALGEGVHLCVYALEHDQPPDVPILLWAEDEAGNQSRTRFFCRTFAQRFRSRNLNVSDAFIASVAPEILSHSPGFDERATPLETFLTINRELRDLNNQRISDLTRDSEPKPLWIEPFLQLSRSQVESAFADYRSYFYEGKLVDRQTHLGFDLASLAQSPVEASNRGRVVYADYLGIYGNTVIVDHGLGVFSLYAHLSSIDVEVGRIVERGEPLGRTGQTGLAAGDHLHFSMVVQGVQVNPIEWWDPAWLELRLRGIGKEIGGSESP